MVEKKLHFKVTLVGQEGSSATGLIFPFDFEETFGTKARVPVRGTINGFRFRSSLMPMGGVYCMAVNHSMRVGAKCGPGDEVDVVMERDQEARKMDAPLELKKELAKNKKARQRWDGLAYTVKKEMATAISGAKQEETKKRRIAKVMHVLKSGVKWAG